MPFRLLARAVINRSAGAAVNFHLLEPPSYHPLFADCSLCDQGNSIFTLNPHVFLLVGASSLRNVDKFFFSEEIQEARYEPLTIPLDAPQSRMPMSVLRSPT